ncbi:MAG: ATP-binding protein [Christensenellaceae bacterium]|jgi:predicted AAA+ superfamily ATPase|nr:ATP-binding protein [Christensenellaceae bacterium]
MDNLFLRPSYFDKLKEYIDKPVLKIISGLRRSGRSSVLKMIACEILKNVPSNQVVYIDLESPQFSSIKSSDDLLLYINENLTTTTKYYLFLDEVIQIHNWELVIDMLSIRNIDLYISGSSLSLVFNDAKISCEYSTVSVIVYPLSFKEFLDFKVKKRFIILEPNYKYSDIVIDTMLKSYIKVGGFPFISLIEQNDTTIQTAIQDILDSILYRGTLRSNIDNELLHLILTFIYENIGKIISFFAISNYLKNMQIDTDNREIKKILDTLEEIFLIKKVYCYNISEERTYDTIYKYYITDHSLQYLTQGFDNLNNIQGVLENIIYIELIRRKYDVKVGIIKSLEVDFIAKKDQEIIYIQVCAHANQNNIFERTLKSLKLITRAPNRIVITNSRIFGIDLKYVRSIQLKDFLLNEDFLNL